MRGLACLTLLAVAAVAGEEFNPRVGVVGDFPREIGRGKKVVIRGDTLGAYRTPELIIIAPGGRTFLNKDNQVRDHRFVFTVAFEHGPGPYRMEIIARGSNQVRWFARFTIWHGRRRPAEERVEPPPEFPETPATLHERLIEKRVFGVLNRFRKKVGVREVGWNEAVAARAREHCRRLARTDRILNRIGGIGVRELLAKDGGGGGLSGPRMAWPDVSGSRPFPRPEPVDPADDKVTNYVLAYPLRSPSLEKMFDDTFVREAAYRVGALDPYCVEAAVGVVRPAPVVKRVGKRTVRIPPSTIYYVVCFVQVNNKRIIAAQDEAYAELLTEARSRQPKLLRYLGLWGRPKRAVPLLEAARHDARPDVAAASYDALLLLREEKTRREFDRIRDQAGRALNQKRYGAAAALWRPLEGVVFDVAISREALRIQREANEAAEHEMAARTAAGESLKDLLRRAKGLPAAEKIRKALDG